MKSIRFRVIGTYLIIIVITIMLFGTGVYSFIRNYYMDTIESTLIKGQDICGDIYNELYYQYDINTEPEKIGRKFIPYTRAQILLMDTEGSLLFDSSDTYYLGSTIGKDLQQVLNEETVIRREITEFGERTMSATRLLKSGDKEIGILKLTTSMEGVYKILNKIILILSIGGLVIIAIVSVMALIIANTITKPIGKVTNHIAAITSGDMKKQPGSRYNDELSGVTENLNKLSTRLEESEKLREQFIESISHELRTPLTSIKGWIITLKNKPGEDPALMEEGLEIIDGETNRLTGLVDDLLDFSGYASKAEVFSDIDISELIDYVCRQMEPRAERLGIKLSYGDHDKLYIRCDRDRIRQVLINLLDNALKYSRTGDRVHISKAIIAGCAEIKVRDTGPGFSQENADRIFDKKYQGDNATDGRGLGLAISKDIIESHGGTISISTGTGGTVVIIRIPLKGSGSYD